MSAEGRWCLESWGWNVLSSYYSSAAFDSPRMSRRSLRLNTTASRYGDDSLLDSSLNRSASFSAGADGRGLGGLRTRRSHQSLLQTPAKSHPSHSSSSMLSCPASDASLLSSMLDESCIQERTLVDSVWGLDDETEAKDCTLHADSGMGFINSDVSSAQTKSSVANSYTCEDCTVRADVRAVRPSCKPTSASSSALPSSTSSGYVSSPPSTIVYRRDKGRRHRNVHSHCVNVKSAMDCHHDVDGSLCDDCKGKKHMEADRVSTSGSRPEQLLGALLVHLSYTGDGTASSRRGGSAWSGLAGFMSTRLVMFLLLFPLAIVLWFWAPASLCVLFSSVNVTVWRGAALFGSASEQAPAEAARSCPASQVPFVASPPDSERLARLERSLALLWDHVTGDQRKQEEAHGRVLDLFRSVREDGRTLELRASDLLEERLALLTADVEQQSAGRMKLEQDLESRLQELEARLQGVALKTQEVEKMQQSTSSPALSAEVDRSSHDALLTEVRKLEEALGSVREDLQGIMGCQSKCEQLDSVPNLVSSQVRQEVRTLFSEVDGGSLPDPLLRWLSSRFVSSEDLQSSLVKLEQCILGNVSLLVRQSQPPPCPEEVTQRVLQTTAETGLSEQDVQQIVKNALKLYSQDQTGLFDYALESAGGSIISTRCSETFQTKTALMSLFGVPLWYFSQSPRAVIQPDVHPGNCWAFKGSSGYLVIQLTMHVVPTAFTLQHIAKSMSPSGDISSAPRHYRVYGLENELQEEGKLLGQYTYKDDGETLQTNPVTVENHQAFRIIELRVLSNWGHPEYTCLYRFRVHGDPASQ
ncbi:SUN domain-containing protein 1 isoform X3 [Denticeps clupeoides]|uniref:SUN domain-containing protein 1 isoform X3 n=1 Tax=Denticeps clupeoides TaxID=299321 RepID=UPI0010A3F721|nr:SUN domain-containing protein 1-like isoform X3 [Denticeps clupeoides]